MGPRDLRTTVSPSAPTYREAIVTGRRPPQLRLVLVERLRPWLPGGGGLAELVWKGMGAAYGVGGERSLRA